MATHSGILAWEIPWVEKPGGLYSPWGCRKLDTTQQLNNNAQSNKERALPANKAQMKI